MYYKTMIHSPVGPLTLASDGEHLAGLWIQGQKYFGDSVKEEMQQKDDLPVFLEAKKWLDRYFAGERPDIRELPLRPFRQPLPQGSLEASV